MTPIITDLKLKPQIQLHSGKYFDFLEPEKSLFNISDIAWALSNICRYTGHCNQFYSVAQHSVLVSRLVPEEHALIALLHDAAEAFIGDVSSPLKQLLPDYQALEKSIEKAVFARFGFDSVLPECIKKADMEMLLAEKRDIMPACEVDWAASANGYVAAPNIVYPQNSQIAYNAYMHRFAALGGRHYY